ncbi:hypothetical protein GQ43DRAFT_147852 [Delitschia confertaspora ATCC 74209]|uniref:Uncharacterized protein n=1 Tax=Delitschia confertaspora ATCC 74209 TaxID=1513339 RepID=A0A9P4JFW9_9PLEO|nr:hypothetical protein GQ43DRAFT_147852 [Delitschia confertaspora ATCC 74209]
MPHIEESRLPFPAQPRHHHPHHYTQLSHSSPNSLLSSRTSQSQAQSQSPPQTTHHQTQHHTHPQQTTTTPQQGYHDSHGYWHPVPRLWTMSTSPTAYQTQNNPSYFPPTSYSASATHNASQTSLSRANLSHHNYMTPASSSRGSSGDANLNVWSSAPARAGPWDGVGWVRLEEGGRRR